MSPKKRRSRRAPKGRSDSGRARDVLVDRWRADAVRFARVVLRGTRAALQDGEMESAAMWGLLQAIDRYDPGKGAKFSTYLYHKVRGAVLDRIREETRHADRSRLRFHSLDHLEAQTRRWAPGSKRAAESRAHLRQLGLGTATDSPANRLMESAPVPPAAERRERAEVVAIAMRALRNHPRRRRAVKMYYFEGRTLMQIGVRFGVSEARACQLVHSALDMIREYLDARGISEEDVL